MTPEETQQMIASCSAQLSKHCQDLHLALLSPNKLKSHELNKRNAIIDKQTLHIADLEATIGVINNIARKTAIEPTKRVRYIEKVLDCMGWGRGDYK